MRYQLGPLRQPAGQMTVELEAEAPPGTGAVVAGPVRGSLKLSNTDSGIAVRGTLWVPLELECGRCLGIFEDTLEIEVNEVCALRQVDDPEAYAESEDEPAQIPILSGDELDLTELVRQLIAMNLPLRPLCREECPGLCLRCGKDLNEGPCDCGEPEPDSRWAALKNLKL
ncbi:MAG: DUF177 domain-containing protein [Armatimonadia bacterium]